MPRRSVFIPQTEDDQISDLAKAEDVPFHVMLMWVVKRGLVEHLALRNEQSETAVAEEVAA